MPKFALIYAGGEPPATPEEGQRHFAKYMDWLSGLGDAAVSPMNPFKDPHTVHPDGSVTPGSAAGLSGYTILQADSLEAALDMARSCPFLEIGGVLEVAELVDMSNQG